MQSNIHAALWYTVAHVERSDTQPLCAMRDGQTARAGLIDSCVRRLGDGGLDGWIEGEAEREGGGRGVIVRVSPRSSPALFSPISRLTPSPPTSTHRYTTGIFPSPLHASVT